jgi:hypothetical protein
LAFGSLVALTLALAAHPALAAKAKKTEAAPEHELDNPADGLIIDGSFGYSGGVLSAIGTQDPKVLYGPTFHVGAGWAFPVAKSKSLAVGAFLDGTWDRSSITGEGATLAPRGGIYGALYGKNAHIRIGAGWAKTLFVGESHQGPGLAFAVGWHIPLVDATAGHRPAITIDFVPSWDFLDAGSERLHRWGMAFMVGGSLL